MAVICSKKIILRPFEKKDLGSLVKVINDKGIYKNTLTIPYPYKVKHASDWINFNLKQRKRKNKVAINFGIELNGKLVGGIGLSNIVKNHKAEIGYWLGKEYRGKGVTIEAVRLMTKYGFEKLGLRRIYAYVFTWNKASAKVLERNGFKYEGRLRKHVRKENKLLDDLLYANVK